MAVLNCPQPQVWLHAARNDPAQRRASWYVAAFQIPLLPEAMMRCGNYRAVARHRFDPVPQGSILPPVTIVWGQQDPYVLPALAEASKALCADGSLIFVPEATHWVAQDVPGRVNAILLDFLK